MKKNELDLTSQMTEFTKRYLEDELKKNEELLREVQLSIGDSGDDTASWHDNFSFEQAHRETDKFTKLVTTLRGKLRSVSIIKPRLDTDHVDVGNTVTVKFEGESQPEIFTVLGPDDATKQPGWISNKSPLGSGLIGKKKDEIVEYGTPGKKFRVHVLDIQPGKFK